MREHSPSKNPTAAGILSAIVPGLGQLYCRQWAKGAGFLVSAIAIDGLFGVTTGVVELLRSLGAPVPFGSPWRLLLGSLLFLVVAIWSIVDAVQTAQKST